jgi:hypothetical protein
MYLYVFIFINYPYAVSLALLWAICTRARYIKYVHVPNITYLQFLHVLF